MTTIPGRIGIASRVLTKVSGAVVAETLDVPFGDVHVDTSDDSGQVAFRVATPIAIAVLSGDSSAAHPTGGVMATVQALQETVRSRVGEITGRAVSRVDITITGSSVVTKGRVR